MNLNDMKEFEDACVQGNIFVAKDLTVRFPKEVGVGGAIFLSRLISSIEDLPIGVAVGATDKTLSSSVVDDSSDDSDEEVESGKESEKDKVSREEAVTNRRSHSSHNTNQRLCLKRATVQTLKIAIKAVYFAKSASTSELLSLLVRVLESPRLHYDVNYDIARALIKYGRLSSDDISSLVEGVEETTLKTSSNEATDRLNHSNIKLKTPLHAAVSSGCFELCWLLVERFGAVKSLHMKDRPGGRTPTQLAALLEHIEISDWLLEQEQELADN